MAFVTRPRGNIVTCSIDTDGRIVRVSSIDRDVSAWPEPRGVISLGIQLHTSE